MSLYVVDIHGDIEGDYEIVKKYEEPRKAGHWNTQEIVHSGIKEEWRKCSECGWSNALRIPRNYCPNCGAKMEVE